MTNVIHAEEKEDNITKNKDEADDPVHVLESALTRTHTSKDRLDHVLSRHGYLQRYKTFQQAPQLFFAKPVTLSPIVCALTGWQLTLQSPDVLNCCYCHQVLALAFPSQLTATVYQRLTGKYEKQLASAHQPSCVFRTQAEYYLQQSQKKQDNLKKEIANKEESFSDKASSDDQTDNACFTRSSDLVIPTLFARITPAEILELLESSSPRHLFLKRWKAIMGTLHIDESLNALSLPCEMMHYPKGENQGNDASLMDQLITIIKSMEIKDTNRDLEDEQKPADRCLKSQAAAVLVLTGWVPTTGKDSTFDCAICQACKTSENILSFSNSQSEPEEQRRKRHKKSDDANPIKAHRYYCPWVCGIPSPISSETLSSFLPKPLWKHLADRILAEQDELGESASKSSNDNVTEKEKILLATGGQEDAWVQIHKLLRAGISLKKMPTMK